MFGGWGITWANVDPDLCRHMASLSHDESSNLPQNGANIIAHNNSRGNVSYEMLDFNIFSKLQWRHKELDGVGNHRRLYCLLNRLFRLKSKKTSKLRLTGLCEGTPSVTVVSPYKGTVMQNMFPFDDAMMTESCSLGLIDAKSSLI